MACLSELSMDADARPLAAREGCDGSVNAKPATPGIGERRRNALFDRPIRSIEVCGSSLSIKGPLKDRHALLDCQGFGKGPCLRPFLLQHAEAARAAHSACRWRDFAGDNAKEREFAGSVTAADPDAIGADGKSQVGEEGR